MATAIESRRTIRLKGKIAPDGKFITGSGLRYTLTGEDRQVFGRKDWGKEVIVNLDIKQDGGAGAGGVKVARACRGNKDDC